MEDVILYNFCLIVFAVLFLKFFFSKKEIVKRKLRKTEVKAIGSVIDGEIVKIVGNIEIFEEPLIAPLSKRDCSYYYICIEQRIRGNDSSRWETIIEEEVSSKFIIREGYDYAFINDNKVRSYIVQDMVYYSGFGNDASENLKEYLTSKGHKSESFFGFFNKNLRYKEGVLENREKVAVLGKGTWKDVTSLNLPERYEKVLEISSPEKSSIYLSDDPDTT